MTSSTPETFYPHLREVLDDRFAGLPDAALEAGFAEAFGEGVTPAEYEEFFSGLSRALNSPVLASIGKGALGGAAAGRAAGPYGMLAGAILGGAGGGLSHAKGPAGDVGRGIGSVVNLAGGLTGAAGARPMSGIAGLLGAGGGTGGGSAASVLRAVLARPETAQALRSLLAGRNPAVPLGGSGTAAPASAFAGLLGALSREAEAEAHEDAAGPGVVHGYLLDAAGRPVVDPGDADMRAARLLALLALGAATDRPRSRDGGSDLDVPGGMPQPTEAAFGEAYGADLDADLDDAAFGDGLDEAFDDGLDDAVDEWSTRVPAAGYF